MTEVEFTSKPARDVEEPLYLDSARPRAANARPAAGVPDPVPAAERPLRLDFAREPRPRRRGVPLVLACTLTFLLGAGAGALYLEPPPILRDALSTIFASEKTGDAKTATQAAPMAPQPAHDQAAIPASQVEAPPAPESPVAPSAGYDLPPPPPPIAEPPAKPRAAARKRQPRHAAAATKKHSAEARPARVHSKAKAPLDLDALAKSLQ